jgi:protein TonB
MTSRAAHGGVAIVWHPSTRTVRMSQTLSAFASYGAPERRAGQWAASLAASSAVYVGLVVTAVTVGSVTSRIVREEPVALTFVEKVVQTPPPPPPAPVAVKPAAPAAAAPVVRPEQKIRRLEKPPPMEMLAPREMPTEAPKEADPSEDEGVAVHGEGGKGDPAGLEVGVAQVGVLGGQVGGAIGLPEDAVPPMPAKTNPVPPYPREARAAGKTGTVVLKVVIRADGMVVDVQVMRGEEPFVSVAVAAVKQWKYEPARYKGQAITVYRIIQIPFKLTA